MKTIISEKFIEKAKIIHNDKYDYSKTNYTNSKTKIKIICPVHGEFEQTPTDHLRGRNCFKCGVGIRSKNRTKTTKEFVEKAKTIHGDKYNYHLTAYKNANQKIKITCLIHGEFEQTPNNHLSGKGC